MMDTPHLLQILKINGLNETSTVDSIEKVLDGLKFSESDKQKALETLRSVGWQIPQPQTPTPQMSSFTSSQPPVEVADKLPYKFFIVAFIIFFLLLLGGVVAYALIKKDNTPNNFINYDSPVGFSISYPTSWTIEDVKGVDTSFGGVTISSPPGTSEQLITVGAGVVLEQRSLSQFKTYYEASFEKAYAPISRKIIDKKDIQIDGTDAFEVVYTESNSRDGTSFEKIQVILPADPTDLKNQQLAQQLGAFIQLNYKAQPEIFDRKLAEQVFGSLREHILQTMEQKSEKAHAARVQSIAVPQIQDSTTTKAVVTPVKDYSVFVQCIKDKSALLYSTSWSPHGKEQMELFGTAADKLPYVECSTSDGKTQLSVCKDKNITQYPTWYFKGTGLVPGNLSLEKIASYTGCILLEK